MSFWQIGHSYTGSEQVLHMVKWPQGKNVISLGRVLHSLHFLAISKISRSLCSANRTFCSNHLSLSTADIRSTLTVSVLLGEVPLSDLPTRLLEVDDVTLLVVWTDGTLSGWISDSSMPSPLSGGPSPVSRAQLLLAGKVLAGFEEVPRLRLEFLGVRSRATGTYLPESTDLIFSGKTSCPLLYLSHWSNNIFREMSLRCRWWCQSMMNWTWTLVRCVSSTTAWTWLEKPDSSFGGFHFFRKSCSRGDEGLTSTLTSWEDAINKVNVSGSVSNWYKHICR